MLTFKATYEHKEKIQYRNRFGKYLPKKVSLVRLDPNNSDDVGAIETLSKTWKDSKNIARDIAEDMGYYSKQSENLVFKERYFLALTTQAKTLSKLNPAKILAIAELTDKYENYNYLDYLQVNPEYKNNVENRHFKHIGAAMMNSVKEMSRCSKIYLHALSNAIDFYLKQGFKIKFADIGNPLMIFEKVIKG